MKKLLTALLTLFILTACTANAMAPEKDDIEVLACDEECETPERGNAKDLINNLIPVISLKESLDYLDSTCVLFYSFEDCPWCYDAFPVILDEFKHHKVPLYYVDIKRDERNNDNANYIKLMDKIKSEVGEKMFVPFALFLKDGKIVGSHTGTTSDHLMENGELPLISEKQKIELQEIYKNLFDKVQ